MTAVECDREQDVLDALASGRWPDRSDAELRVHIRLCAICADLVQVAAALQHEHACAWREAQVPASGLVWWRAQLRARAEAARTVARPITVAHSVGGACIVGVAIAVLRSVWPSLQGWMAQFDVSDVAPSLNASILSWVLQGGLPLTLALGASLVLAPVALYLLFSDE